MEKFPSSKSSRNFINIRKRFTVVFNCFFDFLLSDLTVNSSYLHLKALFDMNIFTIGPFFSTLSVKKPISISPNRTLLSNFWPQKTSKEIETENFWPEKKFKVVEKMIDNENRLVSRVEEVFNVWDYVLFGIMLGKGS